MKKLAFPLLFLTISSIAQPLADYTKTAIQSSKYWIDVDYAGDGITGHKLDIHLPTTGSAHFPLIICIYGSAFFSNNSKAATFNDGLGAKTFKRRFRSGQYQSPFEQ